MPTDINMNKIDCFYLCNCSKKILQKETDVWIIQLIIAISTDSKELFLICEGCHKLFEKLFESEEYFIEVKKCLIEIRSKNIADVNLQIIRLCWLIF